MTFRFFSKSSDDHEGTVVEEKAVPAKAIKEMKSFNFQDWLEKMRAPEAFDIVQPLKTFLSEFTATPMSTDQCVSSVRKFLDDMTPALVMSPLFQDEDPEVAVEGMEKYMMNKIYKYCFQPPNSDDECQDQALHDRICLFSFLEPQHFEISPNCLNQKSDFENAYKELNRIDTYKAPRDKMICVMNCCRIINGILLASHEVDGKAGADEFLPLLIYIILRSNPPKFLSNLLYIQRFRNPDKLLSEQGYYFTNMMSAVHFIQTMDASRLTIDPDFFDRSLTAAGEAHARTAEQQQQQQQPITPRPTSLPISQATPSLTPSRQSLTIVTTDSLEIGENKLPADGFPSLTPPEFKTTTILSNTATVSTFSSRSASGVPTATLVDLPPSSPIIATTTTTTTTTVPASHSIQGTTSTSSHNEPPSTVTQLLEMTSQKPLEKFTKCTVEDLTMSDIPLLLEDYRRLARLVDRLSKTLQLNTAEF